MKKIALFLMPVLALAMLFTGCDKNKVDPEEPVKSVGTFTQAAIVDAVAGMYAEWTETTTIPQELRVSNATLTLPQYQYAMARLMVDIRDGNAGDIEVLNFKPADHPERDSYDAETIAVYGGPSDGSNTEDLGNIAERMIAAMSEDGQVLHSVILQIEEGDELLAFMLGKDGEGRVFPYYICRNGKSCFLKRCTPSGR